MHSICGHLQRIMQPKESHECNKITPWNQNPLFNCKWSRHELGCKKLSPTVMKLLFQKYLYRTRKSPLPYSLMAHCIVWDNFKIYEDINCHTTYGLRERERWETCVGFNEVTLLCVLLPAEAALEPRCVTGQSITVLPKAHSYSEVPCRDRNEPAVQRGVRGVGPGKSSLLTV